MVENFTTPRGPSIPSWFRVFYNAYSRLVPYRKKNSNELRQVKSVMFHVKEVDCKSKHTNIVLGRYLHSIPTYDGLPIAPYIENSKAGWLN